ncbi:unnamed protein product [Larinioides sclopetarius]|uniref:Uncharacterized protein n=1 Tax=Larinioides sclopetarius TaxID=280406 RepID=A0AAV1ZN97_9ARAC
MVFTKEYPEFKGLYLLNKTRYTTVATSLKHLKLQSATVLKLARPST